MPRFRKRPVEIEAVHLAGASVREAIDFVPADQFAGGGVLPDDGRFYVDIKTLEGTMRAVEGDWIIKGVAGEFYPCRDDIFRATYEEV
ncbi:hypothetical protein ELQ39_15910 [Streptomyces sp. GB4-14]|uniref:hypothetical protein n=1 Tax=Streptomyces sp. GB4-14 TaxID=2498703 RepID=UPI001F5F7BCA|nr:hypothetical protein [Streptomyces sp. GB4-14]